LLKSFFYQLIFSIEQSNNTSIDKCICILKIIHLSCTNAENINAFKALNIDFWEKAHVFG